MEGELDSKRSELQKLKDEETSLEREYDANKLELDSLTRNQQDTQLQISQLKGMVVALQESQRQMNEALVLFKAAISSNDPMQVADYQLNIEPDFYKPKNAIRPKDEQSPVHEDKFNTNGFASDPFAGNQQSTKSGFDTDFSAPQGGFSESFGNSGFQSNDSAATLKNVDPFGDKSAAYSTTPDPNKDDFGSDPFAILHAPTSASQILSPSAPHKSAGPPPRPESPSPALPPKKAKQPPPRPAPPRPTMGPTPTRPEPPSSGFGASSGGFADFANFEDTPIQPAPVVVVPFPKPASVAPAPSPAPPIVPKTTTTGATDFADDPFKDYRYEDPFSIKDPFADDIPDDPFASITAVMASPSPAPPAVPTPTTLNNNVLSTAADSTTVPTTVNPSPTPANGRRSTDFFDAFHDNFNKNSNVPKPIVDPFGVDVTNNNQSIGAATFAADFSDNLFEDEFAKVKITNDFGAVAQNQSQNGNSTKTNVNFAKFDAFGNDNAFGDNGSTSSDHFADFEDSFATSFSTAKSNNKGFGSATGAVPKEKNTVANHSSKESAASPYSADYSKGDTFDKDLDEVLKRSLVDQ